MSKNPNIASSKPLRCYLALLVFLSGCGKKPQALSVHTLNSPAPKESIVPQATKLSDGRIALSWQEPLAGGGYKFAMAIGKRDTWSDTRVVASGSNLSKFTADLPGIAELPGGALLAYWELKDLKGDRYATAIQTSVSKDEGKSWRRPARPYGDSLAGQHSFMASFPDTDGLGLVWLDAQQRSLVRNAVVGDEQIGAIGLRYAHLNADGQPTREAFIEPITCECCPTSATSTGRGPVVVFRGRQETPGTKPSEVRGDRPTVRDIYIKRLQDGQWSQARLVHQDSWVINACPDNGPAVDSQGDKVAVAWWTRSEDDPKVLVAFSRDAGDSFTPAFRVDAGKAEGQVTVALLPLGDGAVIGWLEGGKAWARLVSSNGIAGSPVLLGNSPRHSRLPKWLWVDGGVTAVWTSLENEVRQVQVSRIQL